MARAWDTCSEADVEKRWYPAVHQRRMSLDPARHLASYMRAGAQPILPQSPAIQVDPATPTPSQSSPAPSHGSPHGFHYYESPVHSDAHVSVNEEGVHELIDPQIYGGQWLHLPGYHDFYGGGHGLSPQGSPAHTISSGISDLPDDDSLPDYDSSPDFSPDDSPPCQEAQAMVRYGATPQRAVYNVPPMGRLTSYVAARYGPVVRPPLAGSPRRSSGRRSRALSSPRSPMLVRRSPPTPRRRRFPCMPCRRC